MKRIIIILPYFGKFPNYFNLFLKSIEYNSTINWLIITDQNKEQWTIPDNCKWIMSSFEEQQIIISKFFGCFPDKPYDFCKYRAAFHKIFSNEVNSYDFWGFCDCDLIFGNIRSFLTEEILGSYDKISWRGHLSLFRNAPSINDVFRTKIPGYKSFDGCINGTDGLNLFDEVGINKIFDYLGLKIYKDLPLCDLKIRSYNFICNHNLFDKESNVNQIFRWNKGKLFRIFLKDHRICEQEVIYVHFLKRPMALKFDLLSDDSFLIIPNQFIPDSELDYNLILKYSKRRIYWSYWKNRIAPTFILKKISEYISPSHKEVDSYER